MKSKILVFVQFSIIALMIFFIGGEKSYPYLGLLFILTGLGVGLLALSKNRLGNFNIRPDIKDCSVLIQDGIYGYIRHPMYTSVLVTMFGVLLISINMVEIILYLILVVNMLIKMFYEEKLWISQDFGYAEYSKKTYRLIPFLF